MSEEPLRWRAWPAAERPLAAAALALILAGIGAVAWLESGAPLFAGVAVLLVAGFLHAFLAPTRYEATEEGLSVRHLGRAAHHRWSAFRNLYVHATGAHLSPFDKPSALDPFRGVFVLYGREREKVVARLQSRVGGR